MTYRNASESEPRLAEITFNDPIELPKRDGNIIFNYSPKSGNNLTASFRIPTSLKSDDLAPRFVNYFYSRSFQVLAMQTKSQWHSYLKRFFNFLNTLENDIPVNVGNLFLRNLENRKLKEHGLYDTMRCIRWVFQNIQTSIENEPSSNLSTYSSKEYKRVIAINESWPTINVPERKQRDSMKENISSEAPENDYNDGDLLHSLRFVLLSYLSIMQNIREQLHCDHPTLIEKAKKYVFKFDISGNSLGEDENQNENRKALLDEFYLLLVSAAERMDGDFLLDLLFIDQIVHRSGVNKAFNKESLTISPLINREQKLDLLKSGFNGKKIKACFGQYDFIQVEKRSTVAPFTLRPIDIFKPSKTEEIALSMLLASDRIQPSNQNRMTFSSFHFEDNRLEIVTFKARSGKVDRVFYPKSKPQYKLYKNFSDVKKLFLMNFFNLEGKKLFNTSLFDSRFDYAPKVTTTSTRGINAITFKNSSLRNYVENKSGDNTLLSSPFIDYWGSLILDNQIRDAGRYVALDSIARSRVNMIEEEEPLLTPSTNMDKISDSLVGQHDASEMLGMHHSIRTHYDLYRSRSKIALQKQDRFAAIVGDEMAKSAELLDELIKAKADEVLPLSPKEARQALGLGSNGAQLADEEDIQELISNDNFRHKIDGVFNQIKMGDNSIILMTPLVAELMRQYIDHIDKGIEDVAANSADRANDCALRALVLNEILSRFPKKIIFEGKERYGHFQFPFPNLMVTIQ